MQFPTIPYTILALAPTGPIPGGAAGSPKIVTADLTSLGEAVEALGPRFDVAAPQNLCPEARLTIEIRSMKDFKPEAIVRNTPYLKGLSEAAGFIGQALAAGAPAERIAGDLRASWPNIPLDFTASAAGPKAAAGREASTDILDDILGMVQMPAAPGGQGSVPAGPGGGPGEWKNRIEGMLASLLELIFADGQFRLFESAWRGIEALLKQGAVKESEGVRLKIAPTSMDSLEGVLEKLGRELLLDLPNLILVDLPFDSSPRSMELLEKTAEFAESLLVPVVCWIKPGFFHLEAWKDAGRLPYLAHFLDEAPFAKWRKLRKQTSSSWIAALCNGFLSRPPYGAENAPRTVAFREEEPPWLSPVWALGALAAQSVNQFGWPSRLTDYMNIRLKDLGLREEPSLGRPIATEMAISEDRLAQFIEAGITPLAGMLDKDAAFFPKAVSVSGEALPFQLLFSRALSFLFWCKDNLDDAIRNGDIAENLKQAFSAFWEKTAGEGPEELSVVAGEAAENGTIPLEISMIPPRSVLRVARAVEFTINW